MGDGRITVVTDEHNYEFFVRCSQGYDTRRLSVILRALEFVGLTLLDGEEHPEEVMDDGSVVIWLVPSAADAHVDYMAVRTAALAA